MYSSWIEDLIALAIYEQIAYRHRLCIDKYNEIYHSFIQNTIGYNLLSYKCIGKYTQKYDCICLFSFVFFIYLLKALLMCFYFSSDNAHIPITIICGVLLLLLLNIYIYICLNLEFPPFPLLLRTQSKAVPKCFLNVLVINPEHL